MQNFESKSSHKQILKSTGITGGSQVVTILIQVIRTKIIAILLGPFGIGLIGLYQSTFGLITQATGLGLGYSAMRDIAEANGSNNITQISKTIIIVRRWVLFTGIIGAVIVLVFCKPLSIYTFGHDRYTLEIALLSIIVFMTAISSGQIALLQGLRKITQMAKATILGTPLGFIISVPLYFIYGINGIVPSLIISTFASLLMSWYYSRKILIQPVRLSIKQTYQGGLGMAKLGFSVVIISFVSTATIYGIKVFLSNNIDTNAVGLFQASWTISSVYIGIVLNAMAADYVPRLSAVNNNNNVFVKLVNEQTEIGMIIATPIVVGMLSFLPAILYLAYSSKFLLAVPLMQWMVFAAYLKVIAWPMDLLIQVKLKVVIFVLTQLFFNVLLIGLFLFGWTWFRIEAIGMAFLIASVFLIIINFFILRKKINFFWTLKNIRYIYIGILVVFLAFLNSRYIVAPYCYINGVIMLLTTSFYSLFELNKIIDIKGVINSFLKK